MPNNFRISDVAARLRLRRSGREWRGPCPACGYESDPFTIRVGRDGRPFAFCASCRDRDAIRLALSRASGGTWTAPAPHDRTSGEEQTRRRQERALALWSGSEPATGTLADQYLTGRGLPQLACSPALRFRGDCPHPKVGGKYPAMVALVVDAAGAPLGVHRTYLARDGSGKAAIKPPKASLGHIETGAIRLADFVEGQPLIIGEGIETSASAGRLMGLPAWSAISCGNLAKNLRLPFSVRHVVIASDADRLNAHGKQSGQDAARAAWLRWKAEGRRVEIATPDRQDSDFNDVLLTREADNG